jgi:hypothetical protein
VPPKVNVNGAAPEADPVGAAAVGAELGNGKLNGLLEALAGPLSAVEPPPLLPLVLVLAFGAPNVNGKPATGAAAAEAGAGVGAGAGVDDAKVEKNGGAGTGALEASAAAGC